MRNHIKELEFEKQKRELLDTAKMATLNKMIENDRTERDTLLSNDRKSLWEYEIIEHRRKKRRDFFLLLGGLCGFISLIISGFLLAKEFSLL